MRSRSWRLTRPSAGKIGGRTCLIQMLKILEQFDLADMFIASSARDAELPWSARTMTPPRSPWRALGALSLEPRANGKATVFCPPIMASGPVWYLTSQSIGKFI